MNIDEVRETLFDIASEFYTTDTVKLARINRFINRAANQCNENAFGDNASEYIANLTAHNLTLSPASGEVSDPTSFKDIVEKTIGDVKFKFASTTSNKTMENPLSRTKYGLRCIELQGGVIGMPFIC